MNNFFLVCPIGLEEQLLQELKEKWQLHFNDAALNLISTQKGGIELQCELPLGLSLNKILKCPSKILLRLKIQKCRDIPKLYNIFKKFPWKRYLNQEIVDINVTAKKSRLIHTDKIKQAALSGITDYFQANKIKVSLIEKHKGDPIQSLYVRLHEDELSISLDTSGELLHIRGTSSYRGKASIRENIASLLLWRLIEGVKIREFNLIDPMCGTGTFLKEAMAQFELSHRSFNYQYLNQQLLTDLPNLQACNQKWRFNYFGFDNDHEVISHLKDEGMKYEQLDLFKTKAFNANKLDNIVIINPPYGKRVKINENKYDYFKKIIVQVESVYRPISLGLIIPTPFEKGIKGHKLYFKQNGIDVCFVVKTV